MGFNAYPVLWSVLLLFTYPYTPFGTYIESEDFQRGGSNRERGSKHIAKGEVG